MYICYVISEINNKRCVPRCSCTAEVQIEIQKVGVLPIRIIKSNVSSVGHSSERNMISDTEM